MPFTLYIEREFQIYKKFFIYQEAPKGTKKKNEWLDIKILRDDIQQQKVIALEVTGMAH